MTTSQFVAGHNLLVQSPNSRADFPPPGDNGNPVIALCKIAVQYLVDKPLVLNIEQLTIGRGERVAIIGPSGAGKTTLLRLLNGYVQPNSGQVNILGNRMNLDSVKRHRGYRTRAVRRQVGFVFQDFSLVERATVFQNVLWGRLGHVNPLGSLLGWFSETDKIAAMEAIAEVDLLSQTNQRVDTLSGGQQQRVGVARVLAQEAEIILADEPVSNLDPALADDVLGLLSNVSQRRNATLIMSLHQPPFAQCYADRIIGLRAGRIVYDEPSERFNDAAIQAIYGREVNMDIQPGSKPISSRQRSVSPSFVQATS